MSRNCLYRHFPNRTRRSNQAQSKATKSMFLWMNNKFNWIEIHGRNSIITTIKIDNGNSKYVYIFKSIFSYTWWSLPPGNDCVLGARKLKNWKYCRNTILPHNAQLNWWNCLLSTSTWIWLNEYYLVNLYTHLSKSKYKTSSWGREGISRSRKADIQHVHLLQYN